MDDCITMKSTKTIRILEKDNIHIYKHLENDLNILKGSTVLIAGSKGFLGKTITNFLNFLNEFKSPEKVFDSSLYGILAVSKRFLDDKESRDSESLFSLSAYTQEIPEL